MGSRSPATAAAAATRRPGMGIAPDGWDGDVPRGCFPTGERQRGGVAAAASMARISATAAAAAAAAAASTAAGRCG